MFSRRFQSSQTSAEQFNQITLTRQLRTLELHLQHSVSGVNNKLAELPQLSEEMRAIRSHTASLTAFLLRFLFARFAKCDVVGEMFARFSFRASLHFLFIKIVFREEKSLQFETRLADNRTIKERWLCGLPEKLTDQKTVKPHLVRATQTVIDKVRS